MQINITLTELELLSIIQKGLEAHGLQGLEPKEAMVTAIQTLGEPQSYILTLTPVPTVPARPAAQYVYAGVIG